MGRTLLRDTAYLDAAYLTQVTMRITLLLMSFFLPILTIVSCGSNNESSNNETQITKNISHTPVLASFWDGDATIVEDSREFGSNFKMHFLSSVWENDKLYTYYVHSTEAGDNSVWSTYLALSEDAETFQEYGEVLSTLNMDGEIINARIASFPGVAKDNGTWYMVYEAATENINGEIRLATSSDGLSWTPYPEPLWVPSSDWQQVNVGTPSLYKEGDLWYLYYHGYDGNYLNIGILVGTSIFNLEPALNMRPVIVPGTGWDSGTIGKRSIKKEGHLYYMVYEGSSEQDPKSGWTGARWGLGLARSPDLIHWEKYPNNPILLNPNVGFGYDGPEFIETPDGKLHIYFRNPSGKTSRATFEMQ